MLEASSVRARHGEKEATCSVVDAAGADAVRPRERAAERSAHWYVARPINFAPAFSANFSWYYTANACFFRCAPGFTLGSLLSKKEKKNSPVCGL